MFFIVGLLEVSLSLLNASCVSMSYFKAKWTKFDFGLGSAPDPAGAAYSAPPDCL